MSPATIGVRSAARRSRRVVVLISLLSVLLFAQPAPHALVADALKFRTNIFLNGDYVVAGVNLRNTAGLNGSPPGIATGTITINTVPNNATVVSALLYWET